MTRTSVRTSCLLLLLAFSCHADSFDQLRLKWRAMQVGGDGVDHTLPEIRALEAAIESHARGQWRNLQKSPDRTALWADLADPASSSQITEAWERLRGMALAWSTPGQKLFGDPALLADIREAMSWLEQHRYNAGIPTETGNWWDWEIGAPLALDDLLILLYDRLTPDEIRRYAAAVDRFAGDPAVMRGRTTTTGANRVWKCRAAALRAVVVKDTAKLHVAVDALIPVLAYVTSGDGFYEDGSFIQHSRYPYTGGYGNDLLSDLADMLYLVNGTPWDIRDPARGHIYRWVFDSFEPALYRGALMDMVRGREISRSGTTDHTAAHRAATSILRVSQFAPPDVASRMKSLAKELFLGDAASDWWRDSSVEQVTAACRLISDRRIPRRGDLRGSWIFGGMDRVVHQRPGWAFGIAMQSARIANFETTNGENLHAWHTSDGMTYLYTDDGAQFTRDYWPTVDPQRLPGTTVITGSEERTGQVGGSDIAGGASVDGYSAVMMQMRVNGGQLEAKKSWFLSDQVVVALGADIRGQDQSAPVETIVENRPLQGNPSFTTDPDGKWACLDGGPGYYFPDGTGWRWLRGEHQGSWRDINPNGSPTVLSRDYQTIWFHHGIAPNGASYAYALLPVATRAQVQAFASAPGFRITENSAEAQAVTESATGLRAVNFWKNEAKSTGGITSDRIASVVILERDRTLTIGIADPTQVNAGSIHIEVDRPAIRVIEKDDAITIDRLSPTLRLTVNVKDSLGRTRKLKCTF